MEQNLVAVAQRTAKKIVVDVTSAEAIGSEFSDELKDALRQITLNSGLFRKEFSGWLVANWHIWQSFDREANVVWGKGRSHYSARTLIEFIRHETFIRESNSNFKVNNSYVPDIGRLYGLMHPDRSDFFECRVMSDVCMRTRIRSNVAFGDDRQAIVSQPTTDNRPEHALSNTQNTKIIQ